MPSSSPSIGPSQRPTLVPTLEPQGLLDSAEPSFQVTNLYAFAVLTKTGGVVTWGDPKLGGNSSSVRAFISSGVKLIVPGQHSFAALKQDGSVYSWGSYAQPSASAAAKLRSGVVSLVANEYAFAALKNDSSVVTFGHARYGGDLSATACNSWDSSNIPLLRTGVTNIVATAGAFAALKVDGTVVSWGDKFSGGGVSSVSNPPLQGIRRIFSNRAAFAALNKKGQVVTWGSQLYGGSKAQATAQVSAQGVVYVYSNARSFVALHRNREISAWGDAAVGGSWDPTAWVPSAAPTAPSPFPTKSARPTAKPSKQPVIWPTPAPSAFPPGVTAAPTRYHRPTRRPTALSAQPTFTSSSSGVVLQNLVAGLPATALPKPGVALLNVLPLALISSLSKAPSLSGPGSTGTITVDVSNLGPSESAAVIVDNDPVTALHMTSDVGYLPQTRRVQLDATNASLVTLAGEWVQVSLPRSVALQSLTVDVPAGVNDPSSLWVLGTDSLAPVRGDGTGRDTTTQWTLLGSSGPRPQCKPQPAVQPPKTLGSWRGKTTGPGPYNYNRCTVYMTVPIRGPTFFRSFRLVFRSKNMDAKLKQPRNNADGAQNLITTVLANVALSVIVPPSTSRPTAKSLFSTPKPSLKPATWWPSQAPRVPSPRPTKSAAPTAPTATPKPSPLPTVLANTIPPQPRTPAPTAAIPGLVTKLPGVNAHGTRLASALSVGLGLSKFESVELGFDGFLAPGGNFVAGRNGNAPQTGRVFVNFQVDSMLLAAVRLGSPLVLTYTVNHVGTGLGRGLQQYSPSLDLVLVGIYPTTRDFKASWAAIDRTGSTDDDDNAQVPLLVVQAGIVSERDAAAVNAAGPAGLVRRLVVTPSTHPALFARLLAATPQSFAVFAFVSSAPAKDVSVTLPVSDYGVSLGSTVADYSLYAQGNQANDWAPVRSPAQSSTGRPWATNSSDFSLSFGVIVDKYNPAGSILASLGNPHTGQGLVIAANEAGRLSVTAPDSSGVVQLAPSAPLRRGKTAAVVLSRVGGVVSLFVDGARLLQFNSKAELPADWILSLGSDLVNLNARLFGSIEAVVFTAGSGRPPAARPTKTPVWSRSNAPTIKPTAYSLVYSYSSSGR